MDVWTECYRRDISIHALREEGDPTFFSTFHALLRFQSTPSARRATTKHWRAVAVDTVFQSTPSARRATKTDARRHPAVRISIHALREEGDLWEHWKQFMGEVISIHALREEGDQA